MDTASTIGLSAFATEARDFIERISGSPFENQEEYRFRGAEVTARTTRVPRLDLRGAYSFLDSDEVTPAGTRPLQTRPRHRSSFSARRARRGVDVEGAVVTAVNIQPDYGGSA